MRITLCLPLWVGFTRRREGMSDLISREEVLSLFEKRFLELQIAKRLPETHQDVLLELRSRKRGKAE